MNNSTNQSPSWISGFWRRIGAFLIDSLILGAFGYFLGLLFSNQFVLLGGWGRALGFIIALLYFGVLNSGAAGGQTVGKKLLKIRVVTLNNVPIGALRSFGRYSILGLPFFLNGAQLPIAWSFSSLVYLISLVVFGGLLSTFYLYIFNRNTRQSLHDLVASTYVVNANANCEPIEPVWRPHLFVVAALLASSALAPILVLGLADKTPFAELQRVQDALAEHPVARSVGSVTIGQSTSSKKNDGSTDAIYLSARVALYENQTNDEALAQDLANVVVAAYPEVTHLDVLQITLVYGWDIGIASFWYRRDFNFRPSDVEKMLEEESSQAMQWTPYAAGTLFADANSAVALGHS